MLGPQFDQLKMFYGAQELKDTITESGDRGRYGSFASHYGLDSADRQSSSGSSGYHEKESLDEMWDRKLAESKRPVESGHGGGVHASIVKRGYVQASPVRMHWDTEDGMTDVRLSDAHHRIAAAADIEQTTGRNIWINAEHHDPEVRGRLAADQRRVRPPGRPLNSAENSAIGHLMSALGPQFAGQH